jgi:putative peptidoglycan lipid II flippase
VSQRIALTSFVLFGITATVAVTGYLRELILARIFGASTGMDAFYFSIGVIQAAHDLLFGAALMATIVPLLHRREDDQSGTATIDPARFTVTAALTITLGAIAVAVVLRAALPSLIDLLAPKMGATVRTQCVALSTLLVWMLPLNALMNLCVFVLNAYRRFILAGTVYLIVNLVFIGTILLTEPIFGVESLSIASLAGPLVVVPVLAVNLARLKLLRPVRPDFSKEFFLPVWRQARPILLTFGIGSGLGLLLLAHLIVRSFAADSGEGSIAALGYAFRLYEVPLSLIANPAAVMILPSVAIMYKAGRTLDIASLSREALLAGLIVLFAAAVVTWISADFVVRVLLQHGNFGPEAARLTSEALRGFAPAIFGEGIIVVFYRVFYAIHLPSRTVAVSFSALIALLALLHSVGHLGFIAIPLSLSASFLIGALILGYFIAREIGVGGLPGPAPLAKWMGCAIAGIAAWKLAEIRLPGSFLDEAAVAVIFALVYSAAILLVFADYRRFVFALADRASLRVREMIEWGR